MSVERRPRAWVPGLVLLALAVGVLGWWQVEERHPGFVAPRAGVVDVAPTEPLATNLPSSRVAAAQQAADVLTREVGRLRARCLSQQDFDQVERALAWRRPALGTVRRQPLRVAAEDYGPATLVQARTLGFVGMGLAWDEGASGVVVSRDPAFDRASGRCTDWMVRRAPGLVEAQTEAARFRDLVEDQFVTHVTRRTTPLLLERARCVARTRPGIRPRWFVTAGSMAELMRRAGVRPGRVVAGTPPLVESDVPSGEVRVAPPPEPARYTPSRGEVALAERYVACAGETGFTRRLDRAVGRAADRADRVHGVRATTLVGLLRTQLSALADPGTARR